MYGEMSQQQSTKAKLDAQGGAAGAASVDVMDAQIKAKTQQDVLDAQLKEGDAKDGLKSSAEDLSKAADKLAQTAGTLAGGKTAADIASVDKFDSAEQYSENEAKKASAVASKEKGKMLLDKLDNNELVQSMIKHSGKGDPKLIEEATQQAKDSGLLVRQEDGSYKAATGTAFSDAMATLNAGDMGRDKQVQMAGTSLNIDRDSAGKSRITSLAGDSETLNNDLVKVNNTDTQTRELQAYNGDNLQKTADALKSSDAAKFHANPLNDLSEAAAFIQSATGMDPEAAAYVAGAVGLGGVTALATNKFTKAHVQMKEGQLSKLNRVENEAGELKGYENSKGKMVADREGFILDKGKRLESGAIGRSMRNVKNAAFDLFSGNSTNQSTNSTINEGTKNQNENPTNKTDNVQHNNTSSDIDSKNSIPKSGESVKPSVQEQISAQQKTMEKLNADPKYTADASKINTQYAEQVRLNGGETPEMASRHAGDMANLQDSHLDKISKHETALAGANTDMNNNRFAKPNKNFKRLTAIANSGKALGEGVIFGEVMSDAPKHSMNEGNYNMARLQAAPNNLISGAMTTVMSSVASAGNVLDTINPLGNPLNSMSNKYLGTNLSTASTQLLNQSANSFGNAWRNVSNIGSGSHDVAGYSNTPQSNTYAPSIHNPVAPPVPQHAQTAFSTQPMAYTSAAMSDPGYNPADSKNAYGDTTNVANTGAASYRTDSTQESLDRQEDTSLGIEYMQEETSRAADASEKLLETIYSNNQVKKQSRYNE